MAEKIIIAVIVAAIAVLAIRKYYKIFTGKRSACSCGQKNINPKSGCGCGCCGGKKEEEKITN
ncbi:hypothetical protein [Treponema pedis]|uniref:FeoB-associated Cys-rich membrane protein n=1 Tax=Treponema pedis str. T A4 TaxID=1291379 RepID=S6A7Y2_9SPIR|nr:hypothetical protein [Treponema pedis]AGT42879.1 hypothetical protein TPE_0383 [Treponema pedis str. T A4]QSI03742.1 hypothetical protein DYQ05_01825 [Treponema pedis]